MDQSDKLRCSDHETSTSGVIHYSSDISHRWEKIHSDMKKLPISGVQGTTISAVYANTSARRSIPPDHPLSVVGFSSMTREPSDEEVPRLIDDAIAQVLGPRGLSAIEGCMSLVPEGGRPWGNSPDHFFSTLME
jgi:hypothetical protein